MVNAYPLSASKICLQNALGGGGVSGGACGAWYVSVIGIGVYE